MPRRSFASRWSSWLVLAIALAVGTAVRADRPPNVVLIVSDDHAWKDYSFMGHPSIQTPRIDRLASESLVFRRGYVTTSLCSPSLASILTGRYPHEHGITGNDPPLPPGKTGAAAFADLGFREARREMIANFDRLPTIPRLLATRDFASYQSGKWWGGDYRHGGFTSGMTHGDPDKGGRHGDVGLEIGRKTMTPIFDFIDGSVRDRVPFFAWYAPMLPHQPHDPPERLLAKYRDKTPSLHVAKYWACVEWLDETIGQLLDHLDAQGVAQDTLVIYLADNGWIQDPDAARFAPRSKQSPNEGGLRTPILLRWPGKIKPSGSDRLAQSIDLAPTILSACGIPVPADLPGINLLDHNALEGRDSLFGAIFTHNLVELRNPVSSLRFRWTIAGDWKLILPDPRNEPDAHPELYNLARDPDEWNDQATVHADRVESLLQSIDAWWPAR